MDGGRAATGLITAFIDARKREANGALLAVRRGSGGVSTAIHETVSRALGERPGAIVHSLGGTTITWILPTCSSPEARAAAEAVRASLAPASAAVGIVNFYEFFLADGTPAEIAREIERTARRRLEAAAARGGVCDTSDRVASGEDRGPRAFVIEPDPVAVEQLTAALEAVGFAVSSFQNGEAAVAGLEADPPGIVICEAMTPRLNGFVIHARLRASPRLASIPFILISHRKTEPMIRRAVEADIRHFFRKPLSIIEITGLARNLTRSPPA